MPATKERERKYLDLSALVVRGAEPGEERRCEQLLKERHYLPECAVAGHRGWQIAEIAGEWVAISLWAGAAKRLKPREEWVGWDARTRAQRLKLVVQQARYCVLVDQPNLASCVLGAMIRHLGEWWQQKHGFGPLLAETFVDPQRFLGTCYRAAGWQEIGLTKGYHRSRDYYQVGDGLKSLWLKPLVPEAATLLSGPPGQLPAQCRPALALASMGVLPIKELQAESLYAAFQRVPDPRAVNRRHRCATVLTIVAMGILMGHTRVSDFIRLATQLNVRQRRMLGYWRPPGHRTGQAPGKDVFYTLLSKIDPDALAAVLNAWLATQRDQLPSALALDGKAVGDRLAQVISLVQSETGATVAIIPVLAAEKEHEVPAARALLGSMDLEGSVVSLDAGHANHATAQTIVRQGGDYLIQLKGNCPNVEASAEHAATGLAPLFSPTAATTAASSTER
jgi:hypothetical protein